MAKTRNGIIIYWRVRVASNFDSSTTMKQERKTRRQSLVVFPFFFFGGDLMIFHFYIWNWKSARIIVISFSWYSDLSDWLDGLCNTPPLTYTWQTTQKFAMNYKFVSWPHLTHNSVFLRLLSLPATVSRLFFFSFFWVIFINNQHIHTQPKASPLCILTLSTTGNLRVGFSPIHMYPPPTSIDLVCVR